ncbi:futalosine hydrolase [Natribacillus halophilus]|uniref:Futalosine hydrolase n=1 Tax=Natribacillus halophilus TaxID=549003 RepID=A0A1G8PH63_9BACI|nr:futalosine hydrolase [Natribacillus halophilus]SDI91821.1 futalosine hydrolase [Natribacillus halophilus]
MAKILIMTAVEAEKEAVERGIGETSGIDVAIAGVGPAQAAARTAFALPKDEYRMVVSVGIGGGFKNRAAIGDIVISDRLIAAELGAESSQSFIPIDELGFGTNVITADDSSVQRLSSRLIEKNQRVHTGAILTLSMVTGTDDTAHALIHRYPDACAEAMEGFGVATAAAEQNLPVLEIRSISNLTGPRDKENWNIKEALASLEPAGAAIKEVFA